MKIENKAQTCPDCGCELKQNLLTRKVNTIKKIISVEYQCINENCGYTYFH